MYAGRLLERLKAAQRPIIWVVQRTILHVTLFLLYFLGFGLSRLLMTLFARRTLMNRPRGLAETGTWWRAAEGYELSESTMRRQS